MSSPNEKHLARHFEVLVRFNLPEWFPPQRMDYSKPVRFDAQHAWAGSYSHSVYGNWAHDDLWKQYQYQEYYPNAWVMYAVPDERMNDIPVWIEEMEDRLHRFFSHYKEARQ